ncbi:MAG TPA: hypothetical protein PLN21_11025 [Gemmatales bacterium]|nr:hypothetical protein [Gemmatales bacterium]
MKIKRVVFVLLIAAQLASTGCWCLNRNKSGGGLCNMHGSGAQSGCFTAPTGCNECSGYGPQMFGNPVMNNAMLQSPNAPVDERLGTPAKQTPYEGPAKK